MPAVRLLGLLLLLVSTAARAQTAPPASFAAVETLAAGLATQPYKEPPAIEGELKKLGYDQYRALRTRPGTALWRESGSLFRAEFFPAGFIYDRQVQIFVVDGEQVTEAAAAPDTFDFSDTGLKQPPARVALAGFKITFPLNRPDKFDEVAAFLGASYFRLIGRGQVYGASARGLAIDTGVGKPEEFPFFKAFWLVRPADGAGEMAIWALLDSPGASGAYAFTLRPGQHTVIETRAILYLRNDVGVLGIAPLTSMFFSGKSRPAPDDYRPEIHDSDGLQLATGSGERLWRPLDNPSGLAVAAYRDNNPRGFGLLQRERDFNRYQDTGANLQARPGLWVEPLQDWGEGEVRLVEIPSHAETNDNIAAFWVTRWPARKGERKEYLYRVSALSDEERLAPGGRVVATRSAGVPNAPKQRRMVVEFAGGELAELAPQQPVESDVSVSNAKVARTYVEPLPWNRSWRLIIDFEPQGKAAVDLRAKLTLRTMPLTETWTTVYRP